MSWRDRRGRRMNAERCALQAEEKKHAPARPSEQKEPHRRPPTVALFRGCHSILLDCLGPCPIARRAVRPEMGSRLQQDSPYAVPECQVRVTHASPAPSNRAAANCPAQNGGSPRQAQSQWGAARVCHFRPI